MFLAPPREREATSWLLAAVWTLGIFVAIPLARMVQEQVQERWGRATFGYVTVAVILAGTVLAFRALPRPRGVRVVRAVVLLGTSTVFVAYALRLGTEEAMHFVQYGVLGVLVYRALTHRVRDAGVYVVAVLIGTIVGTLDELVQWLTPRRFWGLADIWLNLFAVTLVQVGIGLGIAPPIIRGRPAAVTLRWISRLGACAVVLLGASLLNTPARVSWYASRVPGLASLARNPSMMMEYGYLYEGPETGRFRSRLSPVALAATDRARAAEAAALLDRYRDDQLYEQFLATITPVVDPFVHEVRVRLYRRNRYLALAEAAADPGERQAHLVVAAFEQRILDRVSPATLAASAYGLTGDQHAVLSAVPTAGMAYDSPVSGEVVTAVSERQVLGTLAILLVLCWYVDRRCGAVTSAPPA